MAKQRGAHRGRKKALSTEQIEELQKRAGTGEQKAKLAREYGISRETLYQYLRTDN
ncbi:Transposon Tn21 resolvase (fragment) [Candidatus Methylobacter favarea]|uniref:Transposon Tn21 resolvase n=1 Tax=Candidatus Methylobacter favarea TaxID=2707345 RepID=A0A8S0Y5V5_9GAMM